MNGKPTNRRQLVDHDTITIANNIRFRLHDAHDESAETQTAPSGSRTTLMWASAIAVVLVALAAIVVMPLP